MNTTSMEFVLAQEKSKKSPLVLSEFMGISSNMTEALQINPWNLGVSYRVSYLFDVSCMDPRAALSPVSGSCLSKV